MIFKKIRFRNFLSFGNTWTYFNLNSNETILISGTNGVGKCLDKKTKIEIEIPKELEKLFIKETL